MNDKMKKEIVTKFKAGWRITNLAIAYSRHIVKATTLTSGKLEIEAIIREWMIEHPQKK